MGSRGLFFISMLAKITYERKVTNTAVYSQSASFFALMIIRKILIVKSSLHESINICLVK